MTEKIKEMLWKIKRQDIYDDIGYFKTPLSNDDADKLLNYITNLQQEIKEANDSITWWTNRFNALQKENEKLKELCDKYEEEHKTTFETWKKVIARNEKAIEYIKDSGITFLNLANKRCFCNNNCADKILNILQGGDK